MKILKAEPGLTYPIPVEKLAAAFDILEIQDLETHGFEGGLLIAAHKANGIILVNNAARTGRRRFTIGHELGHFLIETHKPVKGDRFLCSRDDMSTWSATEQNIYAKMEVEANRFAALLLMPPPLLRPYLAKTGDPKIEAVLSLHDDFGVSKDAAARAYAQFHGEPITMAIVHDGKLLRTYRAPKAPFISINQGDPIPRPSSYWHTRGIGTDITELTEVPAGHWLTSEWGRKLPNLYEQVLHQQGDYAMILLWPEFEGVDDEDYDPDEDRTSKQRLADRIARTQHR
ncbi:MAG: ImmA/IrrE family metallo-endopeptidase [Rhizobiaceae bacterium]|nr:ImmA/IrrE family metallo-endopeptidase [Rhizobiaceae bacterium]